MKLTALLFVLVVPVIGFSQEPLKFKISDVAEPATSQSTQSISLPDEAPTTANEALSEFNYFPRAGAPVFEVQPQMVQSRFGVTQKAVGTSTRTGEGYVTDIRLNWRVRNNWTAQVGTDFGTVDYDTTSKAAFTNQITRTKYTAKGMGDFRLRAKGQSPGVSQGFVYYGAEAGFSPAAKEIPFRGADGSRFSGGYTFAPFVSYEKPIGNQTVGLQGELVMLGNRAIEMKNQFARTLRAEEAGGHSFSATAFSEWARARSAFGLSAQLGIVTTSSTTRDGQSLDNDPYQFLRASAYGKLPINQKVTVLPSIAISNVATLIGGSNVDEAQEVSIGAGFRFGL